MRGFVILCLMAVFGSGCYGQISPEFDKCASGAKPQAELNKCASEEAVRAYADLNVAYNGLLAKIAGDKLAIAKVKAAERVWLLYRDAYIEAVFPR